MLTVMANTTEDMLEAAALNQSIHVNLEDLKMDSNFAFLLCSLVSAMAWVIYITYYNSRVIGYFITRLLNRLFIREGYMHVGSFTCNVLSGKIMFRDIVYITHDYTVRVQDGWLIFRWWRAYVPKDVSEDLSHSDTRLSVMLNGFELHVYNRCDMYANLEKVFGLEPQIFMKEDDKGGGNSSSAENNETNEGATRRQPQATALSQAHSWRDLIPVIKIDVASGRVVFGNRLVPTTLSINVEEAHFVYSTKPAASRLDHFMHFTKCKAENFKVILAPSPKYTGMVDDPPRYMGEGFVVLSANNIELYYYMDEAGLVPEEPEMLQLANGDIVESAPPIWGMDIKCGKGTDFSYGPWADRQRDHLFKFFFPNDCQALKVTKAPQPGEKRSATSFDIRLSTLNEATIDILFSKNKETNAVHINVGPGSYLEVTMPWVVQPDGYTTKITGQLLHLEATTSLQYRSLVESETLEFTVKCHYPIKWNDHQDWVLHLTGCKATVNLIYAHKWFFQDMVNDWSSKSRPDLLHFVPYTWKITLLLKEFELITISNEYNWIDCSSQNQENAHIAFCGDLFDLSFDLPFCDFLPATIPLKFWIQGESVDLALYLPEICTCRSILLALDANSKLLGRDGNIRQKNDGTRKWRNVCLRSNGWVDCWSVPIVALCINYIYHPMPPLGPPPQADITTPEKEEILLSPMRIPRCRKSPGIHWSQDGSKKFDPTTLPPDRVTLELEIGPSVLLVYGSLLRHFMHLKENIFGEDQAFTDMHQSRVVSNTSIGGEPSAAQTASDRGTVDTSNSVAGVDDLDPTKIKEFDPRQYRPFEVSVSITMHDIQAHLVKNCSEADPPCPVILLERFGFEMKKGYKETLLQLLLSPAVLLSSDKVARTSKESHLAQGHLMLSGFQVRGHAMFSDEGRSLDEETLEYGWLVEIQLGKFSGKLTAPQLHHLVTSLETFVLLARDAENNLRPPRLPKACHHGLPPLQCSESDPDTRYRCPSGDDIKYRMTRVAIDAVDLYIVENGTAFHIWASPIRVATCNLHGHQVKSGITGVLPTIQVRQFISTGSNFGSGNNHSNTNTVGSNRSQHNRMDGSASELWLEVGSVSLGPLVVEAAMSLPTPEHNLHLVQHRYLRSHDEAHKRLWFLWSNEGSGAKAVGRCGCIGGCAFFGNNRNGAKFFKPSRQDFQDGINIATYRIHEQGRDHGFGQSILHEGQLVFHTPPYGSQDILLQEPINGWESNSVNAAGGLKVTVPDRSLGESPTLLAAERSKPVAEGNKESCSRISTASPSPVSSFNDKRVLSRRFSYTSATNRVQGSALRDVPYARLVDNSPTNLLPPKLDSDSKLNTERSKSILSVPETETAPKSSVSDSKLAVDYFNTTPAKEGSQQCSAVAVQVPKPPSNTEVNASESHHSLSMPVEMTEENLSKEVQRTVSMSSENHSEAFYSADEDIMTASRTSSLRHSVTLTRQDSGGSATTRQGSLTSNVTSIGSVFYSASDDESLHNCMPAGPFKNSKFLNMDDENYTPPGVFRQGSICSTVTSGASIFYSASEESTQKFCMPASCPPSIGNSNFLLVEDNKDSAVLLPERKKFSSELSIVPGAVHTLPSPAVMPSTNTGGEVRSRLSSHRSDHEIHTPEHRNQQIGRSSDIGSVEKGDDDWKGGGILSMTAPHRKTLQQRSSSPRFFSIANGDNGPTLNDVSEGQSHDGILLDSSDSHSVSSTSFISAVSSQEDMALVNLHMQVNKPIIDSPLLMSSYVSHLSQVNCNNWSQASLPSGGDAFTVPLFQHMEEGKLIYIGGKYSPRFVTLTEGFTSLKMIARGSTEHHGTPPPPSSKTPTHPYAWDTATIMGSESDDLETGCEEELLALQNECGTRTTVIIKLKGDMDVMISPLVLESLQRFIDAVTPTLATLHPLTVLNHLHAECISQVEAANILKKDHSLSYLSQFQASSKRSTAERNITLGSGQANQEALQANVYEESISSQTQGTVILPKVNITLLQASVVEEMISFSALDNIRDLTCVSLFAVCFDGVTARFHLSKQAREVVQTFHRPAVLPGGYKKSASKIKPFLLGHQTNSGATDMISGEPVYIETSEKQQEEMVFTLNMSKIHAQLRRLRNESSILKDAVITAIPSHYSRVFFTCARITSPSRGVDFYAVAQVQQQQQQQPPPPPSAPQQQAADNAARSNSNSRDTDEIPNSVEEKLGFIMFECGLEGVSLKVVKRSQFEKGENGSEEEKSEHLDGDASHTDTVRSRDELDSQPTVTSVTGTALAEAAAAVGVTKQTKNPTTAGNEAPLTGAAGESKDTSSNNAGNNNATTASTNNATGVVVQANQEGHGNTSSCIIEFSTVWFNFAAPPRAPITRKIDFTRLDWNLLSTASPAINAWMNPSNRFAIRLVHMIRSMYRRSTGIVACLMAEALDVQGIHMPVKSRYGRYTPLAKTLQEDPSCQLCSVLQKYVIQSDLSAIEDNLRDTELPMLSTLRQGVIVLSRQWKNVLYTPLLLDHKYKSKHVKPLNVTFAVPEPDEENVLTDGEGEGSGEECEVTDECAMLLNTEAGAVHKVIKANEKTGLSVKPDELLVPPVGSPHISSHADHTPMATPGIVVGGVDSLFNSPSPPSVQQQTQGGLSAGGHKKRKKSLPASHPPSSSRASIVFPILSGNPFTAAASQRKFDAEQSVGYGPLREERSSQSHHHQHHHHHHHHHQQNPLGSNPSIYSGGGGPGSQHSVTSLDNNFSPTYNSAQGAKYWDSTGKEKGEDLYSWMAKQQDFMKDNEEAKNLKGNWESKINTLTTEDTLENADYLQMTAGGYSLYPMHDSLRLLDAHLIFEPLLSCLGVMPQQMISNFSGANGTGSGNVSSFETWGSNLSLVGSIETMRIDIVVSEFGKTSDKKKTKNNPAANKTNKTQGGNKFYLDIPPETPAFLCEKMGVELDLKKMADMTVDDMIQKQNVLYISRGQLKKHTSTILNISLNVRYISQQVNMPLLRLLHQISNMYQNVKETQMELKEQHPEVKREGSVKNNTKNGSSSTSDLHENASVTEDKLKLPTGNGPGVVPGFPHSMSQQKILSPSASLRSRPQSFAQKLRSTSKSVKGYMNLSEGVTTPMFAVSPSGSGLEHITIASDKSKDVLNITPRCWKTVYYLLDLYATMPETKTITHRFSVAADISEGYKGNRKYDLLTEVKSNEDVEKGNAQVPEAAAGSTPQPSDKPRELNVVAGERTRLIVFGVARIHRTRLLATLSGLKLEAEITSLHSSLTCRKKSRSASLECSLTGHIGRTMIVLLEGVAPNQQTVVKVTVGKSQALYSSISRRSKDKNSGFLTVGAVNIDIPQHPVALHGMMTRGSKQLSSTLQELRVTRTSSRISRGTTADEMDFVTQHSPRHFHSAQPPPSDLHRHPQESSLLQPLVMQFSIILQSLSITAALLPSLQAQYKMDQVNSTGVTGSKAKFTIDLPHHSLSFTTKLQVTEANLPSEASIALPKVHVSAEYIQDGNNPREAQFADGVVLRQGSYLSAVADIGIFEHSLTTDLLNHLVFVQKVFMKEVNEVVQKVYGGEKPVPLWLEDSEESSSSLKRILFSLVIRIKRIQLTATTPTNSAVRLETGAVEFQLSNRVQNVSGAAQPNPYMKIFGKAQVDINLSLGQLLKNVMFEEAEPEFQQYAFFKTRIGLRNAFQDEMVQGEDKEVVLITLKRPLIYIQPMAVDKAILVWLNYKNAYEYWNEQRSNLNKEVLTATQQVFEKVPFGQLTSQLSSPHLGTLFLQLTVDDMGICLPLNPLPLASWAVNRQMYDTDSRGAVVVTLESTSISACSSGSLVSKGRFVGLCLRFADDFETSLDDWKPDMTDSTIMNLCVVSEGTYEVCSRTIAQKQGTENAKWFLNVQWQMEGVDIHLDTNVGKQLSALGHTLTMLTGSQEDEEPITVEYDSDEVDQVDGNATSLVTSRTRQHESINLRRARNLIDSLPASVFDPSLDAKKRSKLIEKEMNEQAKIINDLRSLGASHGTIEQEMKRLQELEAMVFKDFRRDMIQKLRRQSVKASSIKGKFGLGSKTSTYRSRSFIVPSPTPEHHLEMESPDDIGGASINSNGNSASFESSPRSGPSRSASLRVRGLSGPRVTFSDAHNICRQSSLPSAGSELSLPEGEFEWTGGEPTEISGERVEMRRKSAGYTGTAYDQTDSSVPLLDAYPKEQGGGSSPASGGVAFQKPQEPNIDFELDVKVFINSGKCVLHTKDPAKEDELKLTSRIKKERSCSGGMFDFPPSSPNMSRRSKEKSHGSSTTRLRYLHSTVAQLVDLTIFHIPGLDVKVHYESKTLHEDNVSPRLQSEMTPQTALGQSRKTGTKKASLFAWMTLQSIPEETIISPHILEFLEQTLEPIPSTLQQAKTSGAMNTMFTMDQDSSWAAATSGNYVYASFPVDVIVYFHMQPSTFRFSCLPVSRVECMLQLPSLDIVFSSKRAEDELHSEFGDGRTSRPGSGLESSSRFDMGPSPSAVGGLSVTGCLADFSVYIFHPYGGGKKTGLKEAQWSPLADSERKDSLSVNVEFVKFHLSRSRKLNFQCDQQQAKGIKSSDQSQAVIRFSTIIDIGSASFKYDMRRLTEILAFPKAWYRRSIVRRLFLGDLSISATYSEGEDSSPSSLEDEHLLAAPQSLGRTNMLDPSRCATDGHGLSRSAPERSPMMPTRERLRLSLENDIARHARFKGSGKYSKKPDTPSPSEQKSGSAWETLVLFAVNFTRLNVHMNMGNVMGNVMWLTKDFRSEGRLSIGSTGHKNMYIGVGLGGSSLDAKGGIVGGTIELSKIDTYIHIREDPGTEPDHTVGLKLFALELRLDYMGTGVLMCRVSSLTVSLRDEWKINRGKKTSEAFIPTRRPAMIFMHGDLGWDQLQLMISKSTTADLLKMFYKLEEFFSQQFKSSKRVFSSLQPRAHPKNSSFRKKQQPFSKRTKGDAHGWPNSAAQDARHHRHWQQVLGQVAGLHLSTLSFPLPVSGTVLGGTMELHGNNISLACFHGINFKSKSWALFSLKEPCISFATEAQEVPSSESNDQLDVHVVQTLTFSLGMMAEHPHAQHHSMATVCRLSRNVLFPPQFRTLQEWFHYAFSSSEIDAVDRFPSIERERLESSSEQQRSRSSSSSKLQDPNHTREVIFALPSLQLHLKTEHLQAAKTPDVAGNKPMVECSFITEFEDHIFVTVDAEAFFFLHDLITSYVKEKERVTASVGGGGLRAHSPDPERRGREVSSSSTSAGGGSDEERKRKSFDPAEMFTKDWRSYHCKTWHLEPTVRLLSWAGKSIEPYGVDYILQKLGFSHARTTIPKWMQRGFMDPLDKVLAVLMLRMITAVREEPPASETDSDRIRTDGKSYLTES